VANKSGLENLLQSVLSVGNAEQNSSYPPYIFSNHVNIVTSFLLDALSKVYPDKVDALLGFIKYKRIPVTNGYIQLPEDYRNLLGRPSINVRPDGKDCDETVIIDTASEFKVANLRGGCKTYFIDIVDKNEWDARTTSKYAFPTYEKPIGLFIGERRIKLCPYDLASVEVAYVIKENIYRYGYITQPDDTYIFNAATSIDTQWSEAAFEYLFAGCLSLYSAYSRDNTIIEWSEILKKSGIF